jgi:carbamoyl-phosphate synthase small subunit
MKTWQIRAKGAGMQDKAVLLLEDGSMYSGRSFGSRREAVGEVVFNTSMTGYQEMLTDPSYAGQIIIPTYPLSGNYGINDQDIESGRIQATGFAVRELCAQPNHFLCNRTLDEYLLEYDIPGIEGLDTRAITRKLRNRGVMMGMITSEPDTTAALARLKQATPYEQVDYVNQVSTLQAYQWPAERTGQDHHVVVIDCGAKYSILRILASMGARVTVVPCSSRADNILAIRPDGIVLSPGPGNPELIDKVVDTARRLAGKVPIMGICLGNQVIARAFGARTYKMKFGHRGGNQPVLELANGRVHITAQNHGFAVDPDGLKNGLEVSHINVNDGTVEGLRHKELPVFSIQYHSEASPGPLDSTYLFEYFLNMIEGKGPPARV